MPTMEIIHHPPAPSSFTPLALHQSQTPESFYSGPPVLYHHSPAATLSLHKTDLAAAPALADLANGALRGVNGTARGDVNGGRAGEGAGEEEEEEEHEDEDEEIEIPEVDVWVSSERLILFSPPLSTGLAIPYPAISLHALQPPSPSDNRPASLYLQLLIEAQVFDEHDPASTVAVSLIPSKNTTKGSRVGTVKEEGGGGGDGGGDGGDGGEEEEQEEAKNLYTALSACANLHPDLGSGDEGDVDVDEDGGQGPAFILEGEGDGDVGAIYPLGDGVGTGEGGALGLPPLMPGSGGWITADNVGDFFDEGGNWRGREGGGVGEGGEGIGLGVGAGRVRSRVEDGDGDGDGGDGEGEGMEETKWRRTD